ncbi:unnamed protein product (macronuclear) [Paramecium tetraurelia]|uniref:Palmitoyltransferase n=1 Tax=Paramecium tetraurelia TaxID=5888 RepID=A0DFL3_PARTE|nr:uncharacterized protein GSPATT00016643001 [Paramecium tetraurelia]CAK81830.1 unnamed protein product [Paramecium tetraurelia]|eukprot:XP_001449227.1 hypothetical protein (macronuclear) [Paramecium tetraurelia strain d4-2]
MKSEENTEKQKSVISSYFGCILLVLKHVLNVWGLYTTSFYENSQLSILYYLRAIAFCLWVLLSTCQFRTSFSDPGEVHQKSVPIKLQLVHEMYGRKCKKCNSWKPPRAHHCKRCNKCFFKMDHHCDWENNCIGAQNQKYFVLFLLYQLLYILTSLSIHTIGIYDYCMKSKRKILPMLMTITTTKCQILSILLFSFFFIVFVSQMLWDQISAIRDNQTVVESRQGKFGRQQSFMNNFKQVFGDQAWYHWLLPTKPILKINYAELVYSEELINQGTQYLEDVIYDETNPASIHFAEFMLDNYAKQK